MCIRDRHMSLPKDTQLWRPRPEIYHSATVLEWARRGAFRQIGINPAVIIIIIIIKWHLNIAE